MADQTSPSKAGASILKTLESGTTDPSGSKDAPPSSTPSSSAPSPTPTPSPSTPPPIDPAYITDAHNTLRLQPFIAGFVRAISTLQGAVPAVWSDRDKAASILAHSIPRLTTARLIVYCRDTHQDLEVVAARVLSDMFATEPGLLELVPEEAAVEGSALMQQMWPQAAFVPRQVVAEPEPEVDHPVLAKIRKLAAQWHRLALMPIDNAKQPNPTLWRNKVLNDIAIAKAEALHAGLKQKAILTALESAGDRWVWEIPPAASGFYNDEFGAPPQGDEVPVASMPQ